MHRTILKAMTNAQPAWSVRAIAGLVLLALAGSAPAETWRGLTVAPEHRCSAYDKRRD